MIQIRLRRHDDILTMDIRDNGKGCENVTEGFGLRHMQERLDLLSGSLTYGNRADDPNDGKKGFYVIASVPVRRRQQED
jgi:signal transduction histidine kinase